MIYEIYLYKLRSGETVIGEFRRAETINDRTGEVAHIVGHPLLVPSGDYNQICEWFPGSLDEEFPILLSDIAIIASGDVSLDGVLREIYIRTIYGEEE